MRYVLLSAVLLFSLSLRAQTALEEYRQAVVGYSWQLKISSAQRDAAAQRAELSRKGYLPSLALAGNFSTTVRKYEGVKRWTFSLQPQIIQMIYGGGAVRAAAQQADLGYGIAVCEEAYSELEVRYAADYAYWNLSAMNLYASSMRQYVSIIGSLKEIVDRRFAEGYIAKGDVLMIDARLSEAQYERVAAEQNAEVALHNFNILRGMPADLRVEQAQGIRDTLACPARVTSSETVLRRPDYTAARLRSEQAQVAVRGARAPYNPQFSVGIGGSLAPYVPNQTGTVILDGSLFVKLSVPIFHWGERRRAVGAAQASQLASEWTAAQLHDAIVQQEMNGWTALVQSRAQVIASEQSLRIAAENLTISTYAYGEGAATILDVLQAQLSWIQLYTNAIQAHYNYAVAISDYHRITGSRPQP